MDHAWVYYKLTYEPSAQVSSKPSRKGDTVFPTVTLSVAMETSGCIWKNFELIQALMHVLITCKYEKNSIKNCGDNVMTSFTHYKSMGFFSYAQGQLTP